ncbi:MAG: class I tRNA ligase family protein [Candidatus Zambryskibacteria bacterium]|nr:class I tRNA ligase family protein [Candidatus Zambryskibacteria bacterium]
MADKSERALREEEILQFWKENKIFEKSLEKKAPKGEFIFYDGPPFATGLPHAGSLLSSVIKDVIPRYKTMRGYHVRRRWGWDCHGLPIENMIEKELGIKDKKEIEEKIGIKAFNEACRASVLRYVHEWKHYIDRVGRWVEYDNAYKTMDNSYIESVWNALKEINKKGLLYEGRKVLLYCPHCETPIAKAEIAMDHSYKDLTEESVYVKFPAREGGSANPNGGKKYFLAWTTTPWTLPGNVALAVGRDIDYVEVEHVKGNYILAKDRLSIISGEYKVLREMKGSELVGMEYEPIYEIPAAKESGKKAWYVTDADFVTTEEGTGIVHTAVLYGEDDYTLGVALDLPMAQLLDSAGHFNEKAPEIIRGQYFKKAEKTIKEDLEKRDLLFKKELHNHSYPHCHRCGTELLYNAISSWFINIQKVKDRMIKLNEKINWVPEHLKHGRFLNIVENAPDWTISRNRYWAAPLPIWKDENGKIVLVGSLDELKKHTKKSGNKYFIMRHGEAIDNAKHILDPKGDPNNHLTENGREETISASKALKRKKINMIAVSPFLRTRETAEVVKLELGLSEEAVMIDNRLHEFNESEQKAVLKRMGEFIFDIESRYTQKNILVISHGNPLWMLEQIAAGQSSNDFSERKMFRTAEVRELPFAPYPHNDNFELDLHRPYIDEIELEKDGKPLKRIPEVIDGWVESASMPFAEYHYPFENKKEFESRFPGDFVAEYIAQTRTWFYYMHAVAVILFNNIAFKNVVSTGNVLAKDGLKLSKSKGNYTDPLILLDDMGADAFRYYLMFSVVMRSEDMLFKDEEVKEVHNRVINMLSNSFNFYKLYAGETADARHPQNVLDQWIIARLDELTQEITEAMEKYDMVRATRPVKDFVSDLSTWYIRRSRERFKVGDKEALATARRVFLEFSKLIAPVMPFIAEDIYQKVRETNDPPSVHLSSWPEGEKVDKQIINDMNGARKIVTLALEARAKANIKVRQPLQELRLKIQDLGMEYLEIIKDELNVKSIVVDENLTQEVELDITLTPELIEEGKVRDAIRAVQEWRKEQGLNPHDKAEYEISSEKVEFFTKYKKEIERATNVRIVN